MIFSDILNDFPYPFVVHNFVKIVYDGNYIPLETTSHFMCMTAVLHRLLLDGGVMS